MAQINPTSLVQTRGLIKGMVQDYDETFTPDGLWSHARNAINLTHRGDYGLLAAEPGNRLLLEVPFDVIGMALIEKEEWVVFSTNDIQSEIGRYDGVRNTYTRIAGDGCLNFRRTHLISAETRRNHDGSFSVYWQDARNPDRVMNLSAVPYLDSDQDSEPDEDCFVPVPTDQLDCQKLLLAATMSTPTLTLARANGTGAIANGSYQAFVAYSSEDIRVTDYFSPSNVQAIWDHSGVGGSLELSLEGLDPDYDSYELVLVGVNGGQTQARRVGHYAIRQTRVLLDSLPESLPVVPLERLTLQTPVHHTSDKMFTIDRYLVRSGVRTDPDFNYQPQANKILARWVNVEYPADYYQQGGHHPSFMGGEQYALFIRWIHTTGNRSASYHVPGRPPAASDLEIVTNPDAPDKYNPRWEVYNTARVGTPLTGTTDDGGILRQQGEMGYWESSERYPDDRPDLWGELCGKPIRHHKMPDGRVRPLMADQGNRIYVLGVRLENITHPLDRAGNPLEGIVGYEILRGSREGQRSVIAKGLFNNMRGYDIPDQAELPVADQMRGLYQNYPYNDLRPDYFLREVLPDNGSKNADDVNRPLSRYYRDIFTFHSPETTFAKPFLGTGHITIEGEMTGKTLGRFETPHKHPRHKLLTGDALTVAALVGSGIGLMAAFGKTSVEKNNTDLTGTAVLAGATAAGGLVSGAALAAAELTGARGYYGFGDTEIGITGVGRAAGMGFDLPTKTQEDSPLKKLNPLAYSSGPGSWLFNNLAKAALGAITFGYFGGLGLDESLRVIYAMVNWQQYALQFVSHGFYDKLTPSDEGQVNRQVVDSTYVADQITQLDARYRINNLYRNKTVALRLSAPVNDPKFPDNTRQRLNDIGQWKDPHQTVQGQTSAHYGALKVRLRNQYGQLESIVQIPVPGSYQKTYPVKGATFGSPVLFGGDCYVNRYTEKNTFFYFNTWLQGEPDGTELNYRNYINIPFPRYWADFQSFDLSDIEVNLKKAEKIMSFTTKKSASNGLDGSAPEPTVGATTVENDENGIDAYEPEDETEGTREGGIIKIAGPYRFYNLDSKGSTAAGMRFVVKRAYFYLFNSGVRDFFVESELNLAFRDHGEPIEERHYDPRGFTDLKELFRADRITRTNYFKYDYSLSLSRYFGNLVSWGRLLPTYFDPAKAETHYGYYPRRLIYSLPHHEEQRRDTWRSFLANNYRDMPGKVSSLRRLNQSGAVMLMENAEPVMLTGVDQLQTESGVKITLGDGGLFAQPLQQLTNADDVMEYGSCQSYRGVVNTPSGLYWPSQKTGKIFRYTSQVQEISSMGMRQWFARYLPSELLKRFPDYALYDNPVAGVGLQVIHDPQYRLVYFCKKDYIPSPLLEYDPDFGFHIPDPAPREPVRSCPPGWTLSGNECVRDIYADPLRAGESYEVSPAPYYVYGAAGTAIYETFNADGTGSYTMIPTSNPFWIRQNLPTTTHELELTNGPVNRLSIWGKTLVDGKVLNNYNHGGNNLLPVHEWVGFTTTICVAQTRTVYVGLAADNIFRLTLDGNVLLTANPGAMATNHGSSTVITFSKLHLYPVLLTAGSHTLKLEGRNNELKAGFGCEIYDNTFTELAAANSYSDLTVLFTTRNQHIIGVTEYSCPAGYEMSVNRDCSAPACVRHETMAPTVTRETRLKIEEGDPEYFTDVSWTVSFDPEMNEGRGGWLSFHDWTPDLTMPSYQNFITIKKGGLFRHNDRRDAFGQFYGKNHPFEIDVPVSTGPQVATLRSVEYQAEAWTYGNDRQDGFQVLDENFDQALLYNDEQVSGVLSLAIKPKNNPRALLSFPKPGTDRIEILVSKEENVYRFNQFWDITRDRGEFSGQRLTLRRRNPNGVGSTLDAQAVDYAKPLLERKKFRHHTNHVQLSRREQGSVQLLVKFINAKLQLSSR